MTVRELTDCTNFRQEIRLMKEKGDSILFLYEGVNDKLRDKELLEKKVCYVGTDKDVLEIRV